MAAGRVVYSQTSSGIKKMVIMYLDADVIDTYNCFNLSTNSQDCKKHVQGRKKI